MEAPRPAKAGRPVYVQKYLLLKTARRGPHQQRSGRFRGHLHYVDQWHTDHYPRRSGRPAEALRVFDERVGLDSDATLPLIARHWLLRVRVIALSLGSGRNVVCSGILQDMFSLSRPFGIVRMHG